MRAGNLLFSAVQFIFVIALLLVGGVFVGLEHAPQLRSIIAQFFYESAGSLAAIGYAALGFAFLLLCGFYVMNRGVYYQVEMGQNGYEIQPQVIRSYVQGFWNEVFPEQNYETDIVLHSNQKIEVLVEMPDLPMLEQKVLLSQIEKELGKLLANNLGYRRAFLVTVVVK